MKKYAFLHKNFRSLDNEKKTIFIVHAATLLMCLFPWYAQYPVYGDGTWTNAFGGSWFLIGSVISLCALIPLVYIGDQLLETGKIKLPMNENHLYFGCGLQSLLLIILAWSVVQYTANSIANGEVRYGIFICLVLQFVGIIATILRMKDRKKEVAKDFFELPTKKEKKKEEPVHDHHHPQNLLDLE